MPDPGWGLGKCLPLEDDSAEAWGWLGGRWWMKWARNLVQTKETLSVSLISGPGRLQCNYVFADLSPFLSGELRQADKPSD